MKTNNEMLPTAGEGSAMYDALLSGLRSAEKSRAASVTATWDSILQTAQETVRPPRMGSK